MPSDSKSNSYLSYCEEAALKSPMCFTLGAVLVKGGKVLGSGYNHHRTQYDGGRGGKRPVSMHAEMHAIYNACGARMPAFKTMCVQAKDTSVRWGVKGGAECTCESKPRRESQPWVSGPEPEPCLSPRGTGTAGTQKWKTEATQGWQQVQQQDCDGYLHLQSQPESEPARIDAADVAVRQY